MDVFAHGLWTNIVFDKKYRHNFKNRMLAVFFGVLPDLISFGILTPYLLISGTHFPRPGEGIPDTPLFHWAENSYNYSHSLVIFGLVFGLVWLLRNRKPYWPLLGWLLHIFIDIPTHRADFFPTPIFFPISHLKFTGGFSWAEPWFLIPNWLILLVISGLMLSRVIRKKGVSNEDKKITTR